MSKNNKAKHDIGLGFIVIPVGIMQGGGKRESLYIYYNIVCMWRGVGIIDSFSSYSLFLFSLSELSCCLVE